MDATTFRRFENARPKVADFYRQNHRGQTLDFVLAKKRQYAPRDKATLAMWDVLELLDRLVDDSDPDIELSQIQHALQTAEAARADGQPRWFVLTGLIHDAGKILTHFGEPQWAVVGDTFPVGCAFSPKIVHAEFFADNPDRAVPGYATRLGIYEPGCGFDNVHLSFGHDEYLYEILKDRLPEEALYIIRYHSFYPAHRDGEYAHLMSARDHALMPWVRTFNRYDLYSKSPVPPDRRALEPYYRDLVGEFFPAPLRW